MKTALLIVDVQNDFCPGGALPTPQGDIIVPVINKLMDKFDLIIASRDWHPKDTIHFNRWPIHCVKESHGADFPADLNRENIIQIFEKGTGSKDDGYSAFEATNKNLAEYLKEKEVDELYIVGLTAEYCVKSTVLDALRNGFFRYRRVFPSSDCQAIVPMHLENHVQPALETLRFPSPPL